MTLNDMKSPLLFLLHVCHHPSAHCLLSTALTSSHWTVFIAILRPTAHFPSPFLLPKLPILAFVSELPNSILPSFPHCPFSVLLSSKPATLYCRPYLRIAYSISPPTHFSPPPLNSFHAPVYNLQLAFALLRTYYFWK